MHRLGRVTGMLAVAALFSAAGMRARADAPVLTVTQILHDGSAVDSAPDAVRLPGAPSATVLRRGDALRDGTQVIAPPHTAIVVADARGRRTIIQPHARATFVRTAGIDDVRADSGTLSFDVPTGVAGALRVHAGEVIAVTTRDGAFSIDASASTIGVTCARGSLVVARTGDFIAGSARARVTLRDVLSPVARATARYSMARPWVVATYPSAAAAEAAFPAGDGDGVALLDVGTVESVIGEPTTAADAFARALAHFQSSGDREAEADATLAGADLAFRQMRYDAALTGAQAARDRYASLDDLDGVARARMQLGLADAELGHAADATAEYVAARDLFDQLAEAGDESLVLNSLALLQIKQHDDDGARRSLEAARALAQRSGDAEDEAVANGKLGNIAYRKAEFDTAREAYARAADLYEQIDDTSNEVVSLNNVGIALVERSHLEESRKPFDRALALARALNDPALTALTLTNIGVLDYREWRVPEALAAENEALASARKIQDKNKQGMELITIAETQHLLGRDLVAVQTYRDALELFDAVHSDAMIRVCNERIDMIETTLSAAGQPIR